MKISQREQEERGKSSLFDSVTFIIVLFGLPVPFVFLVTALHQFALMYPLYVVFGAYGLLVTSFVEAATKVIRWTANALVSKHDTEEGTLMTPLVFVLFPQWILFLFTILNSLDCDATLHHQATTEGEIDVGTIVISAVMTIGIPLMILIRAFRQAWKEIDEEEQRQKLNRKAENNEPTRNIIAFSRNVHSKRFNGVTSCLKLL